MVVVQSPSCVSSFQYHGLQHSRLPCPSPSPGACPSLWPLYWWCHPAISPSDAFFSSCPQSFPELWTFLMSLLFTSGDQNIGASAQHQSFQWVFRVGFLKDWLFLSPCCPRGSHESSPAPKFKGINSCALSS